MLPDFGWSELLVIAIVLIVVVGPKDLPKMLRTFGKTTSNLRKMAGDFRKQFDEALKEAELDDMREIARDIKSLDPRKDIKKALNPLGKVGQDLNAELKKAAGDLGKPEASATPAASAKPEKPAKAEQKSAGQAKTNPGAAAGKADAAKAPPAKSKTAAAKPATTAKANGAPTKAAPRKPAASKTAVIKPAAPRKTAAAKPKAKSASTGGKS
jgi:sec-independent protein translocase protein TatB